MNNRQSAAKQYENEEWKDVIGFEGLYKVSNYGRVFSIRNNKFLTPNTHDKTQGKEYLSVNLSLKKLYKYKVHRLVAEAFLPNPENKSQVNHIDFDQTNNSVSNLEWCSNNENMQHSVDAGRFKGPRYNRRFLWTLTNRKGEKLYFFGKLEIAKKFGYKQDTCGHINDYINTGEYIPTGLLEGFKVEKEILDAQRLSEIFGVGLSKPKNVTSQKEMKI